MTSYPLSYVCFGHHKKATKGDSTQVKFKLLQKSNSCKEVHKISNLYNFTTRDILKRKTNNNFPAFVLTFY